MEEDHSADQEDWGCQEKCTFDWVECMDREDRAATCKTRERHCFAECNK
jgi:hypothetical protein